MDFIFSLNSLLPDISWMGLHVRRQVRWTKRILDKHTDLISNVGILAITTCLLAAKVFERTPRILPRVAMVVYNYGGIIWLNVQVRDAIKSGKDLVRAMEGRDYPGILETGAKTFVKGANIVLTCVIFGGSVASAFVMPHASLSIALAIRSFSLSCLMINVASDIRDYFANRVLLQNLEVLEKDLEGSLRIGKVMISFLEILKHGKASSGQCEEKALADRLVRQLDTYTLETFQESLVKSRKDKHPLVDALKLFYGVIDGMQCSQAATKSNLSLTSLGYFSMGICRAFPDSLAEMLSRWSMSVLYTDAFIQRKFFQVSLADQLSDDFEETPYPSGSA